MFLLHGSLVSCVCSCGPPVTLVDGVHLVCIVIAIYHVCPVFHGPPLLRVMGNGRAGEALVFHTAEDCQAVVLGHSGQKEPQLIQKVTRPEVIGVCT